MTEEPLPPPRQDDEEDARAIFARRSLFVAAALASLTSIEACNTHASHGADGGTSTKAEHAPAPCLAVPLDYGRDASTDAGGKHD